MRGDTGSIVVKMAPTEIKTLSSLERTKETKTLPRRCISKNNNNKMEKQTTQQKKAQYLFF